MCMPNKEQLSQEVNEVLGTDYEFDRMKKDDLLELHQSVTDASLVHPLVKQYAKKHSKAKLEEEIDEWYPGKIATRLL